MGKKGREKHESWPELQPVTSAASLFPALRTAVDGSSHAAQGMSPPSGQGPLGATVAAASNFF
jgi:hypothetical protein